MQQRSDGTDKALNEPKAPGGRRDIAELRRLLADRDQRIRRLRRRTAALERRLEQAEGTPPPFFIVGQAKSGTSWVMRLLDAHPEIIARGEGRFFGRAYKRPDVERMDSATLQPSSLHRALLDAAYLRRWIERSVWTRGDDAEAVLGELAAVCTRHILGRALGGSGKELVGDKTPFLNAGAVAELASLIDDARVIHVIRDGRDVAVSAMHHLWNHSLDLGGGFDLTPDEVITRERYRVDPQRFRASGHGIFSEQRITALARSWRTNVSRAIAIGRDRLGDRYTEVRFESLVNDPIRELQRLTRFLGADARRGPVARCVELARFEHFSDGRPAGIEDSKAFARKGVVGDWEEVFTERDRRLYENEAGELLDELGYR
jgi:Sulfotransferase family